MTSTIDVDRQILAEALERAREHLIAARTPAGHWEGCLSSSALSTATASFALTMRLRHEVESLGNARHDEMLRCSTLGLRWLVEHQNDDGGWGDTTDSPSNISTTTLCWAALGAGKFGPDSNVPFRKCIERATAWLTRVVGSLEPPILADAICRRYGDDRTFSVPILTMCALAGQLGPADQAWPLIAQLPFEVAAAPQSWFRFFQLPVVSYALPALIAIGQVRHHHLPSKNPLARLLRAATRNRTLRVLRQVQPPGGGYLEATPLTSFVSMSLIASGLHNHPVVLDGLSFLCRSARPDGSWPIDTNLATWTTTLSINALAVGQSLASQMGVSEITAIREWLLEQQYRARHRYTGAAPGAWAWTNLPGGVPDSDDTAGALLALRKTSEPDARAINAACAGCRWLLDIQNSDGGIPTFCKGWGRLPFDRSAPELTAHALLAWHSWREHLPTDLRAAINKATVRALASLRKQQRPNGSWVPLWFGNQLAPDERNPTYGTARVTAALCNLPSDLTEVHALALRGIRWLLVAQNANGGWGGAPDVQPSIEETSQALVAIVNYLMDHRDRNPMPMPSPLQDELCRSVSRGVRWLIQSTREGREFSAAPIGLYFANLWYSERLYPIIATVSAFGLVNMATIRKVKGEERKSP